MIVKRVKDLNRIPRIVLAALLIAYPNGVDVTDLIDTIYGEDENGGPLDAEGVIAVALVAIRHVGWHVITQGGMCYLQMPGGVERLERKSKLSRVERILYDTIKARPGIRCMELAERFSKKPTTISVQAAKLRQRLERIGEETLVSAGRTGRGEGGYRIEPMKAGAAA